ncbi:transposon Tf2-6 polyprotein [Trichonephila clavipes]|nr:transposon Tf2-6 polyprotein [Trichonephila clavipes]
MLNAPLSIWVDALDFAVGGALAQYHENVWQPLAFLSLKLSASQKNWTTYDREFLAIYTMVKRKLTNVVRVNLDTHTHLDFISQFSTNIQHIPVTQNLVADALSRIEIDYISKACCLDYKNIAAAQLVDKELKQLLESNSISLKLKQQYFPLEDVTLTCDVSTNVSRPFFPKDYRKIVFQHLHGLSHPGIAASTKLATQRFVWPNIRRDIKAWKLSRALLSVWISRFGCPTIITTDQGTNFESSLFRELSNLLGTNRIRCCAYHPKANGLVERLHRHLKSTIKAHENSKWSEIIPIVLLGMRSTVKKDINATCAELVYGTTLRLPSDIFSTDKITTTCNQT